MMRAATSVPPPGLNPTSSRTGLDGYGDWAAATFMKRATPPAKNAAPMFTLSLRPTRLRTARTDTSVRKHDAAGTPRLDNLPRWRQRARFRVHHELDDGVAVLIGREESRAIRTQTEEARLLALYRLPSNVLEHAGRRIH